MKQTKLEEYLDNLQITYDINPVQVKQLLYLIETERSKTIRGFRKELHSLLPAFPTQNKRVLDSVELWYNLMDRAEEQYLTQAKRQNESN